MAGKEVANPWHSITLEELEKHTDFDNHNAWIAVKGIVYDVSDYAASHPGGIDKIQEHIGKDATEVFNMVHSYVDIDAILTGCQVAIVKGHPEAPKRNFLRTLLCSSCLGDHYQHPGTKFKQDSIVSTYMVSFQHNSHESDWTVGIIDKQFLEVFKKIDKKMAWLSVYKLPEILVNDEVELSFSNKHAHADITVRKPLPATVWAKQMHGLGECGRVVPFQECHSKFDAFIIYKKCLTPDILLFGIKVVRSARIGVPLGGHVNICIGDISRPYTPVVFSIIETEDIYDNNYVDNATVLFFMIKIYKHGKLTRTLDEVEQDQGEEIPTLQISTPLGYFDREFLTDFSILLLIAAGSGLTPMIKMMKNFWHTRDRMHGKRVGFIYFCRTDYELIWKKQFMHMHNNSSWFYYFPVLTQPTAASHWTGLAGRINSELIQKCMSQIPIVKKGPKKACVCGPPRFNFAAVDALGGSVLAENIFVFSN